MTEKVMKAIETGLAEDSPTELKKFILLAANIAVDYKMGVNDGVKKRCVDARNNLGEIKKLALDMRKLALAAKKAPKNVQKTAETTESVEEEA